MYVNSFRLRCRRWFHSTIFYSSFQTNILAQKSRQWVRLIIFLALCARPHHFGTLWWRLTPPLEYTCPYSYVRRTWMLQKVSLLWFDSQCIFFTSDLSWHPMREYCQLYAFIFINIYLHIPPSTQFNINSKKNLYYGKALVVIFLYPIHSNKISLRHRNYFDTFVEKNCWLKSQGKHGKVLEPKLKNFWRCK